MIPKVNHGMVVKPQVVQVVCCYGPVDCSITSQCQSSHTIMMSTPVLRSSAEVKIGEMWQKVCFVCLI